MTRTLFLVCAAAATSLGGIVVADDGAVGSDREEILTLAGTALPIGERATFEAELEQLAEVLAAKVQCPAPNDYVRDIVLGHELKFVFDLLREWPAARFRQPLVDCFAARQAYEIECAEALLAYRDDELTTFVGSHEGVRGRVGTRRFDRQRDDVTDVVGNLRLWARRHDFPVAKPFVSLDVLLPECRTFPSRKLKWGLGMTVDAAVQQLHDPDLSVRLQSWSWLAERGIIAPAEDVIVAWPRLNDDHRKFISTVRTRFAGRARLLKLFEELAAILPESESVEDELVVGQVELGSASAVTRARQVLNEAINQDDNSYAAWRSRKLALEALCAAPSTEDVSLLIRISRGDSEYEARLALKGLACVDDPEAIDEVGKFLAQPADGYEYSFVLRALRQQSIKDLRYRDRYLAVLVPALQRAMEINAERRMQDWRTLRQLGDAFVCLSSQDSREAIRAQMKKEVTGLMVGASWDSSDGYQAHSRLVYQDAATSIAKACLHWYSQKTEDDGSTPRG